MHYSYEDIISDLRNNVLNVRFHKEDGTVRVMRATLRQSIISAHRPELTVEEYKGLTDQKRVKDVVTVWDVEVNDWRSFRLDRLIDVQVADIV